MTAPVVTLAHPKPELQNQLRDTWRKSAEHKAAQVKRFISALVGVVVLNVVSDVSTGKNPLTHFTDTRTAWFYLVPLAYVAWRQLHPALTASQADSAPGMTIVPEQVGAESDGPVVPDVPTDPGSDVETPESDGPLLGVAQPAVARKTAVRKATVRKAAVKKAAVPAKTTPAKKTAATTPAKKTVVKKSVPPKA